MVAQVRTVTIAKLEATLNAELRRVRAGEPVTVLEARVARSSRHCTREALQEIGGQIHDLRTVHARFRVRRQACDVSAAPAVVSKRANTSLILAFTRLPDAGTTEVFLDTPPTKLATLRRHAVAISTLSSPNRRMKSCFVVGDDLAPHQGVILARRVSSGPPPAARRSRETGRIGQADGRAAGR